jgi:hypothetical protein
VEQRAKLRVEVRKLFNWAKNISKMGDWECFHEVQHAYRKATVVAKRNSWRRFYEIIEKASETSRLHRILSKENNPHLDCIKLPTGDYTGSVKEILGHLMDVHFPGSRGALRCLGWKSEA